MIRNYFQLHRTYKKITHTKKVTVGDWILFMKRKKSRELARRFATKQKTTILLGQVVDMNSSNSVKLSVNAGDVFLASNVLRKVSGLNNGVLWEKVGYPDTDTYLWNPEWRLDLKSNRPLINETVIYYLYVNI